MIGNIAPKVEYYAPSTGQTVTNPTGVTTDYNVWYAGSKVGTHDQVAASGYKNASAFDFHLNAGAAAIDKGEPMTSSPASDIDGDARPAGTAPDAGADEVASGTPPTPTPTPTATPYADRDADADADRHADPVAHGDADPVADRDAVAHRHADPVADRDADPVADRDAVAVARPRRRRPRRCSPRPRRRPPCRRRPRRRRPRRWRPRRRPRRPRRCTAASGASATATRSWRPRRPTTGGARRTSSDAGRLSVAAPKHQALLSFQVSGLHGEKVHSAKLRMYVLDGSSKGGQVKVLRAGSTAHSAAAKLGRVKRGHWVTFDLTRAVTRDGTYEVRISSRSRDAVTYASDRAHRPRLAVVAARSVARRRPGRGSGRSAPPRRGGR